MPTNKHSGIVNDAKKELNPFPFSTFAAAATFASFAIVLLISFYFKI
jgi:hypothetical protein